MKQASFVLILILYFSSNLSAHPGRTDSWGGHTCRTNCPRWGLKKGEYHYHGRKGSQKSDSIDAKRKDSSKIQKKKGSDATPQIWNKLDK